MTLPVFDQETTAFQFYGTIVVIAVLTYVLYQIFLRPAFPDRNNVNTNNNDRANNSRIQGNKATGSMSSSSAYVSPFRNSLRVPEHVSDASAKLVKATDATAGSYSIANASNTVLVDGLVAFRHSRAAMFEQQQQSLPQDTTASQTDTVTLNRKDRARILSRLMDFSTEASSSTSNATNPPSKGSTIIIAIPCNDPTLACSKLHRVLFLLATYYNVFLILVLPQSSSSSTTPSVSDQKETRQNALGKLRVGVPRDVLPDHRIVASSSASSGRVAFCRQLGQPSQRSSRTSSSSSGCIEWLIDFDPSVQSQLQRFGYRVLIVPDDASDNNKASGGLTGLRWPGGFNASVGSSALGRALLPDE